MAEFLLEIGCEEIPARWLADLEKQFANGVSRALTDAGLTPSSLVSASTPRRLIASVQVAARQEDRRTSVFGPSVKQARDASGRWTPAALGFAKKNGVAPEDLQVGAKDPNKPEDQSLLFVQHVAGRPAADVLPSLIAPILRGMAFPKRMNWDAWLDDGKGAFAFGRPIRWIVSLIDGEVVPFTIFEMVEGAAGEPLVASGRATRGHRFLGPQAGGRFDVSGFADLEQQLLANLVVVRRGQRAEAIDEQLERIVGAGSITGFDAMAREEWPDLVEHPTVFAGSVPPEFAALPVAVRDTVLAHHQKYVPFTDSTGSLRFAAVTNSEPENAPAIVRGMERVVTARLRDARFFAGEDAKTKLVDGASRLSGVTFFQGLGSYADKARRMARLVEAMTRWGWLDPAESAAAIRAARLAKADLTTLMVGEFPELQGAMGALYLEAEGESPDVVHAVRWQYDSLPAWEKGAKPRATAAVGLADRLDTVAAHFSIGNIPSGSRDPYGLRRAGQDAIRVLLWYWPAGDPSPDLRALISDAVVGVSTLSKRSAAEVVRDLEAFLTDRLRYVLLSDPDITGFGREAWTAGEVDAVLGARSPEALEDPREALPRLRALYDVRRSHPDDFAALGGAFKRINNILKQADYVRPWEYDRFVLADPVELALVEGLENAAARSRDRTTGEEDAGFYEASLKALAELREAVDRFFDKVMVMAEDPKVRRARLGLLGDLVEPFFRVADISRLGGQG